MKAPNVKTQAELVKERLASGDSIAIIMLEGMFGSLKNAPEYNDADKILSLALRDIKDMDFGDMGSYINDLYTIAEHWKELAEHYLELVEPEEGYELVMDKWGYIEKVKS